MHAPLTSKLFTLHIVGLLAWMESAQSLFGVLGAAVGLFSAVMIVCINWDKFVASKPVRRLRGLFGLR